MYVLCSADLTPAHHQKTGHIRSDIGASYPETPSHQYYYILLLYLFVYYCYNIPFFYIFMTIMTS